MPFRVLGNFKIEPRNRVGVCLPIRCIRAFRGYHAGMTHILKSNRWLGYAAPVSIVLFLTLPLVLSPFIDTSSPVMATALLGLVVFGLFAAVRGLFVGSKWSRICAGLAWPFWAWALHSLVAALSRARIH
jgi:hypothetical protein